MTAPRPTFLELPLEVREMIYNLCYSIPLTGSSYERVPIPESECTSVSDLIFRRDDGTTHQLRKLVTKCVFPKCHLSLSSVCRQVRNEYFPIFAAHHTFSFCDPLVFANEYLAYTLPHRLSNIRHLTLNWKALDQDQRCGCEVEIGRCRTHPSRIRDITRDLRSLIGLVDVYPEVFSNLESIKINSDYPHSDLFRNAILLLEKLDRLHKTASSGRRKYLVVTHFTNAWDVGPTQLNLFSVSDDIWTQSIDGATLLLKECNHCASGYRIYSPDYSGYETCNADWKDIGQFVSALREGKFRQGEPLLSSETEIADMYVSVEKNWKVLFDKTPSLKSSWENAMRDLNTWKGTNQKSKQRGRKRKLSS